MGVIDGIFPIRPAGVDFLNLSIYPSPGVELYIKFLFNDGKSYTFPYADVIHLRRHFNSNDLLGDNNAALTPALELAHTQNQGIIKGIENGARLRGILKNTQIMAPEKLKIDKDAFVKDYLQMDNNSGVAAIDSKWDFTPIKLDSASIDEKQMQAVKQKIYSYLGISEKIVESSYSENEWNAFYESVVEPLAVQLSLEFTSKIFTDREQAFGNQIVFESNRLQFASPRTKALMIEKLAPMSLITLNEAREILNLPGVPDGDKRLQSLNFINADKADAYQLEDEDE
jgi:HK97 family phage portal protein